MHNLDTAIPSETPAAGAAPVTSATALPDALDPERGDVPGWVLVTLMTAGLVVALWAIAGPLLEDAFTQAISSVTGR
ncbi:hypothetical protein [Xylanimonas sp. McL0601]|uniref:hypothetical protein n=1 Tax=Xylanimonas sp. McL0601 TaxID=3414739 RepID=UPI003CE8459B